ncbi:hypothetical protein DH2020_029725 [Rehmannia glutinosa]|uniref:Retrotransposon gag domain-containing protein n=1 Tax=Rehmannia glutinosa TaxID=99300 RepID=A0ABR0VQZ7_REHGL
MKRDGIEIKLLEQIAGLNSDMTEQLNGINGKYDHLTSTLAAIQLQLLNLHKGKGQLDEESILGAPYPGPATAGNQTRTQQSPKRMQMEQQGVHMISPLPKLDFPRFDGTYPRSWILKCEGYFRLIPNIPDSQKVILASMHFEGRVAQWYQNFAMKQGELTWHQFLEVIAARFEELKESKVIAEFNKLKQTGSYTDYWSEELQAFITMFEPTTLHQTIELGRKQLLTLDAITRKLKYPSKSFNSSFHNFRRPDTPFSQTPKPNPVLPQRPPIKMLTVSEMAARREKGLCYNCDEQFTFGHRCKQMITYMIMTEEEELSYSCPSPEDQQELNELIQQMEEIQMTLNAISGEDGITTMRLYGECGKHKLHILIDSGSTLSFIQSATARKLGCNLEPAKPLLVKVAMGREWSVLRRLLISNGTCKGMNLPIH